MKWYSKFRFYNKIHDKNILPGSSICEPQTPLILPCGLPAAPLTMNVYTDTVAAGSLIGKFPDSEVYIPG
jgi:hypothetical protein